MIEKEVVKGRIQEIQGKVRSKLPKRTRTEGCGAFQLGRKILKLYPNYRFGKPLEPWERNQI